MEEVRESTDVAAAAAAVSEDADVEPHLELMFDFDVDMDIYDNEISDCKRHKEACGSDTITYFIRDELSYEEKEECFDSIHGSLVDVLRSLSPDTNKPLRLFEDQHESWFVHHHQPTCRKIQIYENGEGRSLFPG